jgi:hypothetical protein
MFSLVYVLPDGSTFIVHRNLVACRRTQHRRTPMFFGHFIADSLLALLS